MSENIFEYNFIIIFAVWVSSSVILKLTNRENPIIAFPLSILFYFLIKWDIVDFSTIKVRHVLIMIVEICLIFSASVGLSRVFGKDLNNKNDQQEVSSSDGKFKGDTIKIDEQKAKLKRPLFFKWY